MADLIEEFSFLHAEHTRAAGKYAETHDTAWFDNACEIFERAMMLTAGAGASKTFCDWRWKPRAVPDSSATTLNPKEANAR